MKIGFEKGEGKKAIKIKNIVPKTLGRQSQTKKCVGRGFKLYSLTHITRSQGHIITI